MGTNPPPGRSTCATLLIVAREGFDNALESLDCVLAHSGRDCRLVYVDGGSPGTVARGIRDRLAARGGVLVRTPRYLRPSKARRLGLDFVETPYVVFLDNDVFVTPGWLEPLVGCADETGADYVSPVICIGRSDPPMVHVAGGENRIVERNGRRQFFEVYGNAERPLPDIASSLVREPTTMAEFHCLLARTETLRRLGLPDPAMTTAFEHNDLCLSIAAASGSGMLEPASVVDYAHDAETARGGMGHFLLRWSTGWIEESRAAFCAKWRLPADDPSLRRDLESLLSRRRRPLWRWRARIGYRLGRSALSVFDRMTDPWIERVLAPWHERPATPRVTRFPGDANGPAKSGRSVSGASSGRST